MEKAATGSLGGTTLLEANEHVMCEVLSTVKESKEQQCAYATTLGGSPHCRPQAMAMVFPGVWAWGLCSIKLLPSTAGTWALAHHTWAPSEGSSEMM